MAEYVISLHGCDDVTAFHAELSPAEAAMVRRLAEVSRAVSSMACQPTLHIDSFDVTDIDKVVSIDEQVYLIPATISDLARVGVAAGVDRNPDRRARRLGRGGGVRPEPVGDAVSGVAGQDRPT